MARVNVTLDHASIGQFLRSSADVVAMVRSAGERVATASGGDLTTFTTDRFVASIRVKAIRQARDGALTRGAAGAGLQVRSKNGSRGSK